MLIDDILGELADILQRIDLEKVHEFIDGIINSKRVFVAGIGRSGLVAQAFAMRLMHLGFQIYVTGDATTPAISGGDILIAISGSGETKSIYHIAESAKKFGASIFLITSKGTSSIAKNSDQVLVLPESSIKILPLKSAFELAASILLDALIIITMQRTGATEQEMMQRHSNLE